MEETLTFRMKMGKWLGSNLAISIVVIAIALLTIWKDNFAYFLGIVFVLLLLWAIKWDWSFIGLIKPKSWRKTWIQSLLLSILILIVIDLIFTPFVEYTLDTTTDLSSFNSIRGNFLGYVILILFMWVVAAFGEEFVYRGLLVKRLGIILGNNKSAMWIAAIISSLLFGLAHGYQGASGIISTGAVGLIFGAIFIKNKNGLWLTILTHGIYDVIGITLIYLDMEQEVYGLIKNLIFN